MRGLVFNSGRMKQGRAEQPPDDHPCPRGIKCSWGVARGFASRCSPRFDVVPHVHRAAHLEFEWFRASLSSDLICFPSSPHPPSRLKWRWIRRARPDPKVRVALSAPLERLLEPGELRLREKDYFDYFELEISGLGKLSERSPPLNPPGGAMG